MSAKGRVPAPLEGVVGTDELGFTHRDYVCSAFDIFFSKHKDEIGKALLDTGCRDRSLEPYFTQKGFKWYGVDLFPCEGVVKDDMQHSSFADDSFDVIFCCHALEHVERPIDAIREFLRICKPGGFIFVATPSPCEHQILRADTDHLFVLTPAQMERLFIYAGAKSIKSHLQTEHTDREQDYNVITVARK